MDDTNDASPNFEIEENEEVRTKVSSFAGRSKHKRKNVQESVDDENIRLMTEQLDEIASQSRYLTRNLFLMLLIISWNINKSKNSSLKLRILENLSLKSSFKVRLF